MHLRHITGLLVEATTKVLAVEYSEFIRSHPKKPTLSCQVGAGKRTCHQLIGYNSHKIVYGQKMVESVLSSRTSASTWTMSRENARFNFFNGAVTPQVVLASAVIHEFAHFIQTLNGDRKMGSVHNHAFYSLLLKLHGDGGVSARVLEYLMKDKVFSELEFGTFVAKPPSLTGGSLSVVKQGSYGPHNLAKGMRIRFSGKEGVILRVNEKTVSTEKYRIPFPLITHAESNTGATVPAAPGTSIAPFMKNGVYSASNLAVGMLIKFDKGEGTILRVNAKTVSTSKYRVPFSLINHACFIDSKDC